MPNVTKGEVNMLVQSNTNMNTLLQVYTTNGTLVYSRSLRLIKGLNRQALDFSQLASGYYIVTINTGSAQLTERLIKQ